MRRRLVASLLLPFVFSFGCFAQESRLSAENVSWSERGVFAFDSLVFDFKKKVEVFGPSTTGLVDCSTREFYCAYAGILHVVLPKRCPKFNVGDTWSLAGVTTTIISERIERHDLGVHSYGPTTELMLGDSKFPNVLYEYEVGVGIRSIYLAQSDKNLIALAQSGDISTISSQSLHLKLETLDQFGGCAG